MIAKRLSINLCPSICKCKQPDMEIQGNSGSALDRSWAYLHSISHRARFAFTNLYPIIA
jgi:hypothetical protein